MGDKMKKIKWYLRKIKNMDYQHFFKILKEISEDTHRLRIIILLDMFICSIRYGAGYVDYYEYEFYLMNHKERRTYMTISINKQMVERYNDKKQAYKLHDKGVFNELFNEFLGREWINLEVSDKEAFKQFLKHKDKIIVKPNRDCSGHGIEIISIDKKTNSDELYDQLVNNKQCLVEEVIENHKDIKKIYTLKPKKYKIEYSEELYQEILSKMIRLPLLTMIEFMKLVRKYKRYPTDIKCPTLIMHGDEDELVPLSSSEYVFDKIKSNNKYLTIVRNTKHRLLLSNKKESVSKYINCFLNH
jgi:hypothetical protein